MFFYDIRLRSILEIAISKILRMCKTNRQSARRKQAGKHAEININRVLAAYIYNKV